MSEFEFKVINKSIMLTRPNNRCSWVVEPNIFEAVKAEVIWDAKYPSKQYLPRFRLFFDTEKYPQLLDWRDAFSSDNIPGTFSFRGRGSELAELIEQIDFSKPYNKQLAESIRAKFTTTPTKRIDVDAVEIAENENRENE